MINIYHRAIKQAELRKIDNFQVGSWIEVFDPGEEEIKKIVKMLKVEEDLLIDALDPFEVPRLEQEAGVTYVFTQVPEKRENEIITFPLLIVIGKNFVLTVSKEKFSFLDSIKGLAGNIYTTQKTKFFLQIFSSINYQYNNFLIEINKGLRGIKIRLEKVGNKDIVQFVDFERILNDFISALVPTNSVLQKLLSGKHIAMFEEDKDLVEDLFLDNGQLIEMSKSTLKHVVNIRDAYSNIMTHSLNRIVKILTALTIILTVPTMIFSFFGMNVNLPYASSGFSYLIILGFTLFTSLFIFIIFARNRWL
ncbi:MAG: magnesium transporter CorA family protein [Patescibacteria group bacterium]